MSYLVVVVISPIVDPNRLQPCQLAKRIVFPVLALASFSVRRMPIVAQVEKRNVKRFVTGANFTIVPLAFKIKCPNWAAGEQTRKQEKRDQVAKTSGRPSASRRRRLENRSTGLQRKKQK